MDREFMLERFMASDADYDGRFLSGVLTTGIYCLPSCTARKPLPRNVQFFAGEGEARAAGLRPCRRCRPDRWYGGHDPDRERLEGAVAALRAEPARFASVNALAREAAAGVSKLNALVRLHYHTTPAVLLARARVAAAAQLLENGCKAIDAAYAAGFDSLSAFNENFRRGTGLRPRDWARLGETDTFTLALPVGYQAEPVLRIHGRDGISPTERVMGATIHKVFHVDGRAHRLEVRIERERARCRIVDDARPGRTVARTAHGIAFRMLGLMQDPAAFERRLRTRRRLRGIIQGREGARMPLTADPFEALVWSIVGQQVNLAFAYRLRRALIERAGTPVGNGLRAHPTPQQVAALDYGDLTSERYSLRKAEYLIDAAKAVSEERLRLDSFADRPATVVEKELLGVRGLGPWSTHYLMMRGLGFADCVPVGDTGLATALHRVFSLDERPDAAQTRTLMATFAPYRSLATFHLWLSLGDAP